MHTPTLTNPLETTEEQQEEQQLSLSLLNKHVNIKYDNELIQGEMYYFSSKAIILKRNNEFVMINVENYERLNIEIVEEEGYGKKMEEDEHVKIVQELIKAEEIKASMIVPLLIER